MTLTKSAVECVARFVHLNGRLIDSVVWSCLFENGDQRDVLKALAPYQNADGGFGNGLEPDCWNPESSPYTTLYAVNLLQSVGFTDYSHSLYQGALRFFESGKYFSDRYGWDFSIPSNDNFPHAPWWTYNVSNNEFENVGLTAQICAFILQCADRDSSVFKKAVSLILSFLLPVMDNDKKLGEMAVNGLQLLIDALKKYPVTDASSNRLLFSDGDLEKYKLIIKRYIEMTLERDVSKWSSYTVRPSKYIHCRGSEYLVGNEDLLNYELEYLVKNRNADGVWDITWSWFDNNEKYAKQFAISENWWKAIVAKENVMLLKNFSCLEEDSVR